MLVTAARSSVLLAEAEALRGPVSVAQAAVLAHDKQTAKLQAAVERHTGQRMLLQPKTVDPSEHHRLGELGVPWLPSVRERLEGEVERRQRLVDAVVAAAEGMPVELRWDELPDVLKPGGVGDLGWGPPIGQDAAREAERARIEPLARHAESAYRRYVAAVCDYYAEKRSRSVGAAFKDLEPLRRMAEQAASSYRKAAAAVPGTFHDCQLPAAWPVDSHEAAALTLESAGAQ